MIKLGKCLSATQIIHFTRIHVVCPYRIQRIDMLTDIILLSFHEQIICLIPADTSKKEQPVIFIAGNGTAIERDYIRARPPVLADLFQCAFRRPERPAGCTHKDAAGSLKIRNGLPVSH